jgi:hypothetical protein
MRKEDKKKNRRWQKNIKEVCQFTDKQQLQPVNFVPLRYTKQQVVQQPVMRNKFAPKIRGGGEKKKT